MNIGVDIGGTTTGIIALDREGATLYYKVIDTPISRQLEAVESSIIGQVHRALESLSTEGFSIGSIGIGVPGIVSIDGSRVINCPNLKWYDQGFGSGLFKEFGIRPRLFNDASSAGFGEYAYGALKDSSRGVMITLGTGLGGGMLVDGDIYNGSHGLASEFGHMTVGENYYSCSCGRNGCLETFVSATSMVVHANRLLQLRGSESRVNSAKEIFERYRLEDSIAVETVDRFVKYMAIGINNIILTIDPDVLVIGGGMSLSGNLFLDRLRDEVSKGRAFKAVKAPEIVLSSMDERAGAIGSALLGKKYSNPL